MFIVTFTFFIVWWNQVILRITFLCSITFDAVRLELFFNDSLLVALKRLCYNVKLVKSWLKIVLELCKLLSSTWENLKLLSFVSVHTFWTCSRRPSIISARMYHSANFTKFSIICTICSILRQPFFSIFRNITGTSYVINAN